MLKHNNFSKGIVVLSYINKRMLSIKEKELSIFEGGRDRSPPRICRGDPERGDINCSGVAGSWLFNE